MKAALIPINERPRIIDIEPDEDGSYLNTLQDLVHGLIDTSDVLYGETPLLWVNEEGLFTQEPNRAVYANKRMEDLGYLSQFTGKPVKSGELHSVLFGDIVAVSYDEEQNPRDITESEFKQLCKDFANTSSGFWAVMAIKAGL